MVDLLLRFAVAIGAGAMMRMLLVFGVPVSLCMLGLIAAGAILTYRLVASRVFVALTVSAGHFVALWVTRAPSSEITESPSLGAMALNAVMLFLPFGLPALGSMIVLRYEKYLDAKNQDLEEVTEESLLAEEVPQAPAKELEYDLDRLMLEDEQAHLARPSEPRT